MLCSLTSLSHLRLGEPSVPTSNMDWGGRTNSAAHGYRVENKREGGLPAPLPTSSALTAASSAAPPPRGSEETELAPADITTIAGLQSLSLLQGTLTSANLAAPSSPILLPVSTRERRERFSLRADARCHAPSSPMRLQLRSKVSSVLFSDRGVLSVDRRWSSTPQHLRERCSRLHGKEACHCIHSTHQYKHHTCF